MTDLSDLRRRAAQHASYGSYWPGKVVALCDRLAEADGRDVLAHHRSTDVAARLRAETLRPDPWPPGLRALLEEACALIDMHRDHVAALGGQLARAGIAPAWPEPLPQPPTPGDDQ